MSLNMKLVKKDYNKIFKRNKIEANIWLLLLELADSNGQIKFTADIDNEITVLLEARFNHPEEYAF